MEKAREFFANQASKAERPPGFKCYLCCQQLCDLGPGTSPL